MNRAVLIRAVESLAPRIERGEVRPAYVELAALASLCADAGLARETQRVLRLFDRVHDVRTHPFEAACPFVLCCETGPHVHPVCPKCDTVNFGNANCDYCMARRGAYNDICSLTWNERQVIS